MRRTIADVVDAEKIVTRVSFAADDRYGGGVTRAHTYSLAARQVDVVMLHVLAGEMIISACSAANSSEMLLSSRESAVGALSDVGEFVGVTFALSIRSKDCAPLKAALLLTSLFPCSYDRTA
jgi:hypothetical protein